MKRLVVTILMVVLCASQAFAQIDRREVRSGNRAFRKGEFAKAEIDYKKALLKDSTSVAAQYNLSNDLYRLENYQEAEKYSKAALDSLSKSPRAADAYFNAGDIYLQQRRWGEAIEAFKSSLRLNPGDMDAKSNLAYAQKMLEREQQDQQNQNQNQDNQDNRQDQNKDQNNDQNKDNQDQNQDKQDNQNDQNKDQNDDRQDQNQNQDDNQQQPPQQDQQQPKISPEAAEQMLQAIQAKENETQDKVNKEKAAAVRSRQKEKNW
ncbi:MAG: tetratricopeptide repeat protein [Bacteroidales bacterium]|nr:tetratricopeptide repeat protein [Bacteroidales bacterium]MBQ9583793.1 tetratricopeptide repeat protein [Bacteroidales bacterium]